MFDGLACTWVVYAFYPNDTRNSTVVGLYPLRALTQLHTLELVHYSMTDEGLSFLPSTVRHLTLQTPQITDSGFMKLPIRCARLESLSLFDASHLTSATLMHIFKRCKVLIQVRRFIRGGTFSSG
jgi:hypothetical protein